jgi:hypothetical protein
MVINMKTNPPIVDLSHLTRETRMDIKCIIDYNSHLGTPGSNGDYHKNTQATFEQV